jgi:hypothetical protein
MIATPELNSSTAIELVQQPYCETFTGTRSYYKETIPKDVERDLLQGLAEFEKSQWKTRQLEPKTLARFPFGDDQSRTILNQSAFVTPGLINHIPVQKPYEMSEVARDFINRQKRPIDLNRSLDVVSTRVSDFMKKHRITAKILIDTETDTEFDDWTEPRIKILVEQAKFERAYTLFDELLNYALQSVRKREMKRFRITLDVG